MNWKVKEYLKNVVIFKKEEKKHMQNTLSNLSVSTLIWPSLARGGKGDGPKTIVFENC